MQSTWHGQVLLFVWVGVCFVSHTTRGLRLVCRSGIRVWVRMYTPEKEGENWHVLLLLWWRLTGSRPSFLLRSHPWCWWQSSSPTPLHLALSCAPCTLHCLSSITRRSCNFMSSRVNRKPVNKSKENYQPTRSAMSTAAWSFQQTPRPYASLPCPQYGCEPPVRTMRVSNLRTFGGIFSAKRSTYSIPRLIDDTLPGFLCSFSVPAHHVHRPSWEWTQHTQYFLTLATWTYLTSTLLCYGDGCCSADSTVGTSDHKGPPHHRHIQVLWLKALRCCFIALPKQRA